MHETKMYRQESIMIETLLQRCQGDFSAALVESKKMAGAYEHGIFPLTNGRQNLQHLSKRKS